MAQVHTGRVPAWRARLVAETTIHTAPALTMDAARWVDSQVAAVAGRIGTAQLDRLVAEAIKRFELAAPDPAADPEDGYLAVDPRHATLHDQDVHFAGTMTFEAELDIADALDLDRAIAHGAATHKALGSEDSLDARRAAALGDLARTQTALDLFKQGHHQVMTTTGCRSPGRSSSTPTSTPPAAGEQTDLRSHRPPRGRPTPGPARPGQGLVRRLPDQGHHQARHRPQHRPVAPGVRDPRPDPRTDHSPRPHLRLSPGAPDPPDAATSTTSPSSTTTPTAEGRPQPGPTQTDNLACLCRYHHRLKTFTAWHYEMVEPGVFDWTSPHGHRYRRDRTGTTAMTPEEQADRPDLRDIDIDPAPHPLTRRRRRPVVRSGTMFGWHTPLSTHSSWPFTQRIDADQWARQCPRVSRIVGTGLLTSIEQRHRLGPTVGSSTVRCHRSRRAELLAHGSAS